MLNLIKSELFKLRRQKLMAVLFAAVIAISAFSAFSELNFTAAGRIGGKAGFANAFQDIFMFFIVAVFAGFYIGSDFSNRTIQSALAGGHRRFDIILSKTAVFSVNASLLLLLYPATVCLIHTVDSGWGAAFGPSSVLYLLRVAFLGGILHLGSACLYVCIAFLCRDIPKTICFCAAFPVLFSAVSSTLGRQFPPVGRLLSLSTLSQLKYIVRDSLPASAAVPALLSAAVTIVLALALCNYFFSRAEIL